MRHGRSGRGERRHRPGRIGALALACLLAGYGALALARVSARAEKAGSAKTDVHDIAQYATDLQDLEATVRVTQAESKELEKIGGDFAFSYRIQNRIRNLTLQYKQPDKLRLAGRIPVLGEMLLIINGSTRYLKAPSQKKTEDLEKSPGKRQSLLEYGGLVSPGTLRFMQGHFRKQEMLGGHDTLVFDLTYQGVTTGSRFRVWIDPQTHITVKREWLDSEDKLRATFLYQDPHEVVPGVWLPSRIEVKNAEGATAAVTTLSDVKVNRQISDSLFTIAP